MTKYIKLICTAIIFALVISACNFPKEETPDPHEGMVQVNDGAEISWVPPIENLPVSTLRAEDFTSSDGFVYYSGQAEQGIDVSEHQLDIDWEAVAASGQVDFAYIRAGYRGYTEGQIYEDSYFRQNIEGAIANGIPVGVYFFSQAITAEEAVEEAQFLLSLIDGYELSLPIVYDWERVEPVDARTNELSGETLTDCAIAFCQTVEDAGYDASVYFYRHLGYYDYELGRLADYDFWVGAPGEAPDFYYRYRLWQYSYTGSVPGIEGEVDLNLMFQEQPDAQTEESDNGDGN
ncbi:MAG: glycoside hydrolase family 25 protein [Oscillospiraceae bacterium]